MAASTAISDVKISRADFAEGFVFGSASSAYQIEGAANLYGRTPSIWDTFTVQTPSNVKDGTNGNVAIDQYHLYKEDIQHMKKVGLDAYRFSISWSRVLPGGRLNAGVNKEGIKYYNNLINELLDNGIEPYVTLFHWDVPQVLEDEYGGFLSKDIVEDFVEFAELCFYEFGDRVKKWITLNEPWTFAVMGYTGAGCAPGRGATPYTKQIDTCHHHRCHRPHSDYISTEGNPSTEPYIVTHNLLLAHAAVVKLYRQTFKTQGGKIGITLVSQWWIPLNAKSAADVEACERIADFFFGWYMAPITYGDYPKRMKDIVGARLPTFTDKDSQDLKMSFDFLGLNYYTARYASDDSATPVTGLSYNTDFKVKTDYNGLDGKPIGEKPGSDWLAVYPVGLLELLKYIKTRYSDPVIYITENGVDEINDPKKSVSEARKDEHRIRYHHDHLVYVKQAIDVEKVNVQGYFIWSCMDNFEWQEGYTARYGIFYVNYNDRHARYPKLSALWWLDFLGSKPASAAAGAASGPLPVSAAGAATIKPGLPAPSPKRPVDDGESPEFIIPKFRGRKGQRFF